MILSWLTDVFLLSHRKEFVIDLKEWATHDYVRHGTTTLFAALNIVTGEVLAVCKRRHRHQEYLDFLKRVDANVPAELDIHLVVDNYATHKHPKVNAGWLHDPVTMFITHPHRHRG